MRAYVLTQLGDRELLTALKFLVVQDRVTTAALLAHVAEVDFRRLYLPAGYPSMREYCVRELGLSEDAAYKRIQVARAARDCPAMLVALADGRLHFCGLVRLSPHVTTENVGELIATATHKTKAEIEQLLAVRFPKADLPGRLEASSSPPSEALPAGSLVLEPVTAHTGADVGQLVPEPVAPFPRVKPLSAERFALQVTVGRSTHDKLRRARALLGHRIPSGDLEQVIDRALDSLIRELEKKKFGATNRPRTGPRRAAAGKRTIPVHVKHEVWTRDQGQCTFVGDNGKRCPARDRLEFDHLLPVARGGQATVEGIRLLCRAHNQYEAERTFGDGFMHEKRERARRAAKHAKKARESMQTQEAQERTRAEVIECLRALGLRADESRQAAAHTEAIAGAPLEERVRLALSCFGRRARTHAPVISSIGMAQ